MENDKHMCPSCGDLSQVYARCECHECNKRDGEIEEQRAISSIVRWISMGVICLLLAAIAGCWTVRHFDTERDKAVLNAGRGRVVPDQFRGYRIAPEGEPEPKK